MALNHLVTAVVMAPYVITTDLWPTHSQWAWLAAFGSLQMALPYVLFTRGVRRVTAHEASNIALLDRTEDYSVAIIDPDRETTVRPIRVSTNFQERIEWTEHALFFKTMDRQHFLEQCVVDPKETCESLVQHHLRPPLYRRIDNKGWGTLYTACYFPEIGAMQLSWPDLSWTLTFDSFEEGERTIHYRSDPTPKSHAAHS